MGRVQGEEVRDAARPTRTRGWSQDCHVL